MVSTSEDNTGIYREGLTSRRTGLTLWLAAGIGALLFVVWVWLSSWWVPVTAVDISQLRANTLLPAPTLTRQIRQDFVARNDGLYQVELLVSGQQGDEATGRLEIQLLDAEGQVVAARSLEGASLGERQPLALAFEPQGASAGQRYQLIIGGTASNSASVWGYDLDSYGNGQLTLAGGESEAEDLRFVSRYQLSPRAAVGELGRTIADNGWIMLLALALCFPFLAGCVVKVPVELHESIETWRGMDATLATDHVKLSKKNYKGQKKKDMIGLVRLKLKIADETFQYSKSNVEKIPDKPGNEKGDE